MGNYWYGKATNATNSTLSPIPVSTAGPLISSETVGVGEEEKWTVISSGEQKGVENSYPLLSAVQDYQTLFQSALFEELPRIYHTYMSTKHLFPTLMYHRDVGVIERSLTLVPALSMIPHCVHYEWVFSSLASPKSVDHSHLFDEDSNRLALLFVEEISKAEQKLTPYLNPNHVHYPTTFVDNLEKLNFFLNQAKDWWIKKRSTGSTLQTL
jgi:hypothetical protein